MMKSSLFLLCLTGVVPVILSLLRPVSRKYNLIKTKVTWPVAQNYCRQTFDDLATIESDLDWLKLKRTLAKEVLTDVAWVGLYNDFDSWRWSFSDVPLKNTFLLQWYHTYPYNAGGSATCCLISQAGLLNDNNCPEVYPFICFNANISNAGRFVGVTHAMNWSGAQTYCRNVHTDLAFINSSNDKDMVQSIASGQGWSWIGLYRDSWKWSDGTYTSRLMWRSGQPDNYYRDENCAVFDNGFFTDIKCDELHYFICHTTHPVRELQIVKLKVKSDGSVMDSAMQEDILELVKMKLGENDMLQNTTVTWRVQSDGQVFHKKKKKRTIDEL